jgi:GTPase
LAVLQPASKLPGRPGDARTIVLELKLIADVGLVGYPNAGKSTLLKAISNAKPTVAAYAFTTLHPSVGVVEYSDLERVTVADIPGLIDGAHENRGLGHDFLKHIERTKVLLYVVDAAGTEGRDPATDLRHLINELRLYDEELLTKPALVFANKHDLTGKRPTSTISY